MSSAKNDDRQKKRITQSAWKMTLLLLQAADDCLLFFEGTRRFQRIAVFEGLTGIKRVMREKEYFAMRKRYYELRRRGLIEERRKADKLVAVCTTRGRSVLFRLQMKNVPLRDDGKKTLIIFDIPERYRSARAALRALLRSCGCVLLQRSAWMTEKDLASPLDAWIRREKLEAWIRVYSVDA